MSEESRLALHPGQGYLTEGGASRASATLADRFQEGRAGGGVVAGEAGALAAEAVRRTSPVGALTKARGEEATARAVQDRPGGAVGGGGHHRPFDVAAEQA